MILRIILYLSGLIGVLAIAAVALVSQPAFGRLPRGERRQRIERSPNFRDGAFRNRQPTQLMTSGRGRAGTMLRFLFGSRPQNLRPTAPLHVVDTDLTALDPQQELFIWLGHSSYLIQTGGRRLLVDPVLVQAAPLKFLNRPFPRTDLYTPERMPDVDYLVITHDHWDHLDYATVRRLRGRVGRVICPLGVGEHFARWGYPPECLIELDWDEQADLGGGFTIHCLTARHFSGRGLRSDQTLWASFLLHTPVQRIYLAGDGGYGAHFAEIGRRFPDIDLAVLENGQYDHAWRYIHTMPRFLAREASDLGARSVVTVHHAKYALARHPWDEPLENARRLAGAGPWRVLQPLIGQVLDIRPGTPEPTRDKESSEQNEPIPCKTQP